MPTIWGRIHRYVHPTQGIYDVIQGGSERGIYTGTDYRCWGFSALTCDENNWMIRTTSHTIRRWEATTTDLTRTTENLNYGQGRGRTGEAAGWTGTAWLGRGSSITERSSWAQALKTPMGAGVSNPRPRVAMNATQHEIVNFLKSFLFAHQFSLVSVYLICGPRQLLFFQCGPETPRGWTPLAGSNSFQMCMLDHDFISIGFHFLCETEILTVPTRGCQD